MRWTPPGVLRRAGGLVLALLSLAATTTCATPLDSTRAAGETACSQKFAQAMTSPSRPVQGVFACQAASLVFVEMKAGLGTDSDLASYASKAPVFHHAALSGRMADGGILYLLTGDAGVVGRLFVWVDAAGRVKDFIIAKCAVRCADVPR